MGHKAVKLIEPDWPAPSNVIALSTTRLGGFSSGAYGGLNMADHVGDDALVVASNRALLQHGLSTGTSIAWLRQIHGNKVVPAASEAESPAADGSWTRRQNQACAVLTADCLPVLLCDIQGTVVAAVHAGWRGLMNGILEAAIAEIGVESDQTLAWLGPAIGPRAFEVGPEVRYGFLAASPAQLSAALEQCFTPHPVHSGNFYADLYQLARLRLAALGVVAVYGGECCTYSDSKRFYSYRRDGQTGRMASLIYLNSD